MRKFLKWFIVLLLIIGIISGAINVYAKGNSNGKNIILSEKYNSKKIDRIKNSISQKNNYRFLINTTDSFKEVSSYFQGLDKKIKVKDYKNGNFMVKLPKKTNLVNTTDIDSGVLPTSIGKYSVVQPEIVESLSTYLDGEEIDKLWGNTLIGADLFQEELSTKNKIKVAVLDTGIDYTHGDLDNNYNAILFYDFVNEDTDAIDDNGHGTQVAGIIGAEVNGFGRYGVNSNSDLVSLKILDINGIGTSYDILEAIDYAKTNGIKVINMSFGGTGDPTTSSVCSAITEAKANGIFTIVSAGNNNTDISNTIPAGCSDSIVVGAIDNLNEKASFSNYGTGVIYTPGVNIYTTSLNNSYGTISGTSFSAGFVSGIFSKELAYNSSLTYDEVVSNVKNNYNLVNILSENQVTEIVNQTITGTGYTYESNLIDFGSGLLINPENLNLYNRFDNFRFLSIDENYVYYYDTIKQNKIYELKLNNNWIFSSEDYYRQNPKIIFTNKYNLNPLYFDTGKYINISEYNGDTLFLPKISEAITYNINNTITNTLGKYDLNFQFNNIVGEEIFNFQGIPVYNNGYIYYYDNGDLYKIKSDGSGLGIKVLEGEASYMYQIYNGYIYYLNEKDNYKLYKLNTDGTEALNGGIKVLDLSYVTPLFFEGGYIYYLNSNDNYNLYKIKDDGTDALIGGVKLLDKANAQYIDNNEQYIYYFNYSITNGGLYKIKKDGSESSIGGTQLNNESIVSLLFLDGDYLYYTKNLSSNGILYRVRKDGSEVNKGGTVISNKASIYLYDDLDYIYYLNNSVVNGLVRYYYYKVKKDGTDNHLALDDGLYRSPEILPGKNLTNLKINIDSIIPTGTSYDFYLANQKTEETLFETNESGVDMMMNDIYLFGDNYANGTKQEILSKVNVGDTIYLDKNGNIGEFEVSGKDDWSIRVVYNGQDLWEYAGARVYIGGSNFEKIDNSKLDGNTNLDLNSLFGFTTDKLYYKIELIGDQSDTTKTPVINSVEFKDGSIPSEPTNLKQEILSPYMDTRTEIGLGTDTGLKIGKFQSGSGVILSAYINNDTGDKVRLAFDIYRFGNNYPIETYYSNNGAYVDIISGTLETIIPYLGAGEYYWKARVETDNGNTSQAVDFGTSNAWEYDYALFEGFEPYPYGYSFPNSSPADGVLTGGVIRTNNFWTGVSTVEVSPGNKWNIFYSAFNTSTLSPNEIYDAFESVGLNQENVFQGGNCYGMAVSATMQYTETGALFLKNNYPKFLSKIGNGTIWGNIDEPEIIIQNNRSRWNEFSDITETIFAFQLSQNSEVANKSMLTGISDLELILSKLRNNTDKTYTLSLKGKDIEGGIFGHRVVPYKVEGNKIYIWDNNFQYPYREDSSQYANKQYIEIYTDTYGKTKWKSSYYRLSEYGKVTLVDINQLYNNGNKSVPIGFGDTDSLYTLSGSSDLYVLDDLGRVSGFLSGSIVEEIPGVNIIIPENYAIGIDTQENTWKQIYLPQKQDLTVKISANTDESYDLMIAGGDYYTKVSGVETSSGQVDSFISTRENLQIDFDDNKTGDYSLMIDNFYNSGTGTVYIANLESKIEPQQYIMSWTGGINSTTDAVIYEIDTNNDGTFDESINLPPVYQDNIAPITSYNISGELNTNTTNSYIETATIDLNSVDNEGGTGVDKIYYAIGTDTGSLVYVEYTEPVIVNGLGEYTLNYYAKDIFGNTEVVKTINFLLTERPETYTGNISGYVYDDSNKNGIQDEGEKFMAGWKVCIDLNNNNYCEEQNEPFNVTNNDGYFEFNSLASGTYKIIEIPHQNWIVTNPTEGNYFINLLNGQKVEQKNFGNFKVKGGKK